jgi:hypothetical protein
MLCQNHGRIATERRVEGNAMLRPILFAPLVLAACNSGPTVTATDATGTEVAAKLKAANLDTPFVSPGRWEGSMTISDISTPDMPPQMAERMKGAMGKARTFVSCLTPEEAKAPKEGFFGSEQKSCKFARYTMGNGKIDAEMTCNQGGAKRTMTMSGTYGPDTYMMTIASSGSGGAKAGPMSTMSMKMSVTGKRTGDCTGNEKS